MRCQRLSLGDMWMESRGGQWGCKLHQAGDFMDCILEWSSPLRIPGTSMLCPVALGPGFYIIGLFLEKQITSWRWYYVRELRKPPTCLNISNFLQDTVQVFCCPKSHFWILGWISDPQHHMPSSTHDIVLKWCAYVQFPFQGRDCLITPCIPDTWHRAWSCRYLISMESDVGLGLGIQESPLSRTTVKFS